MNGNVEEEAPRPRPLSAGIWTLFSWLRRPDRSSSSESISSVGSDRTVASFDFLAPLNLNHVPPLVLTQGPVTDTYKKRLDERNLRRQRDRDLTLHRKYGLFREEGVGYDAFSLPTARRLQNRERRAASEGIQRRSAYVPGKRRAPLPPTVIVSATLPRNYKRKRPAPKPPVKISEENKENVSSNKIIQMNSTSDVEKHSFLSTDTCSEKSIQTKAEKNSKLGTKDVKLRTDKSFLKHLFDNKKRNSAIDTSHIKLLPSISELDKQAAEIIEANKSLRASARNNIKYIDSDSISASGSEESWICTTCLRKYKPVVSCCIYCIIKENSSNDKNVTTKVSNICTQTDVNVLKSIRKNEIDEKKKLREMLKEMKDSLPKRPKHNNKHHEESSSTHTITSSETPTLRIGSSIDDNVKINFNYNNSEKERQCNLTKNAKETFLSSQPSTSKQQLVNISSNTALLSANPSFIKPRSPTVNDLRKKVPLSKESHDSTKKFSATNIVNKKLIRNHDNTLGDCVRGDFRVINALLDNKVAQSKVNVINTRNSFTENVKEKDLLVKLSNNNSENKALIVEKSVDKNFSEILVIPHNNDRSSVLPSQACESTGVKNKIEKVHLGNVVSSLAVSIEQVAFSKNSPDDSKTDLHTPMKISSLLNPLYCPKAKLTKVSDCNFANILTPNDKKVESNKKEDKISNEKVLPNITLPTSILSTNVHTPSTSNIKQVDLKKSEATEVLRATCENMPTAKDNVTKGKNSENVTVDIASSCGKVLDNYNRRRNLINQLEQAISKGDEQSAADAAAKLAKLKLACSVLSFSSQIVAETTSNKIEHLKNKIIDKDNNTKPHVHNNSSSNTKASSSLLSETGLKRLNSKNQEEDQKDLQKTIAKTIHKQINILSEATTSTSIHIPDNDILPIEVWVEDKEAARGPIPLRIGRKAILGELKREVEMSLGLEIRLQRWIVGRTLCTDDNTQLATLAGPDLNAPFYLCLVESETNNSLQIKEVAPVPNKADPSEINNVTPGDVYTELMKLERQALVPNTEEFECGVCIEQCEVGAGAVLRECIHTFCRECLADVVRHCEEPLVACPAIECPGTLQEREIRALLSTEEYERWLARGLAAAESGTRNTFHCRTRDCKGWAFCEPGVRRFPCPVCKHTNCVSCQAVHEGETCEQHQAKLREAVSAAETNQTDEGTQALLKSLISRGEALECPECSAIITKKWGCDWIKCSACKTEICWVTRGRRWGPGGKGDTSGGCRCGVEGKRCHPSCGYCH